MDVHGANSNMLMVCSNGCTCTNGYTVMYMNVHKM